MVSELDLGPDSPVFDTLLDLCPWARPHWEARRELIAAKRWNVNHVNQGGNVATKEWLKTFFPDRAQVTLSLLSGPDEDYTRWAMAIGGLARDIFGHPALAETLPGTPMIPDQWGAALNWSATVEGYAPGQFLADVLLLTQSSLRGLVLDSTFDISGRVFPVGLETSATFNESLLACKGRFGPFSSFEARHAGDVDFSDAAFFGTASFSVQTLPARADFSGAVFHGPVTFDATRFGGETLFRGTEFQDSAQFNGTFFEGCPDFSGAVFAGDATFGDAMFEDGVMLEGASFRSSVYVRTLPAEIRKQFEAADHGAGRLTHGQPIY